MAGITGGTPEVAVGEPIRLGDNGEYELEHEPLSDRLVIRDTVNGTEAYVRPETNEQIGNRGAFLRSLINSEPLADDGRTYSTVQDAERAANGWVFVPPGTFNESVQVETDGLTLQGAGYGSFIEGVGGEHGIYGDASDVTVRNLRIDADNDAIRLQSEGINVVRNFFDVNGVNGVTGLGENAIIAFNHLTNLTLGSWKLNAGDESLIIGNVIFNTRYCINFNDGNVVANNLIDMNGESGEGIRGRSVSDAIIIGNRIHNSGRDGIRIFDSDTVDNMIVDNRISDSADVDIDNRGSGTVLDGNLTGGAN